MSYPHLDQDKPYPGAMPPPPPAYSSPPPPATRGPAIMVQPGVTTIVAAPMLTHEPTHVTCPYCQTRVVTDVEYTTGSRTHLFAILLCLICCCLAFIPYKCTSCQTAVHTCPNCKQNLGIHEG